jgi:hypothetical protein
MEFALLVSLTNLPNASQISHLVGHRNGLLEIKKSFLIPYESHKPKFKIILCNYFYVLLGRLVHIRTLVGCLNLPYWYQNLPY